MRIEYHRTLVADQVRNAALYEALKAAIIPGETIVSDIGAGTGIIGLMAARLGAKEVYLYEAGEVAGVCADILKRNRVRNCHLFASHSAAFDDPPKADLVISETLGNYAFEEDILPTLADARARHLAPGGVILPSAVEQFAAPVVSPRFDAELTSWTETGHEIGLPLDFSPAQAMTLNNMYVRRIATADLLGGMSSARAWDRARCGADARPVRKGSLDWKAARPAEIFGFALWWSADLGHGVALSTAPDAPATHWDQLYLPLLEPIALRRGESLRLTLRSHTSPEAGTTMRWTAWRLDSKGATLQRQALDLEKGYLS